MSILHDLSEMGLALAMAIGLFGALFVVPFAILWFTARRLGDAWRWSIERAGGALRPGGPASREGRTPGSIVRSHKT
jgi:hypothetical protein